MKKIVPVFASALLLSLSVGVNNAAAFNFGKIGEIVKDAATQQNTDGSQPAVGEQQNSNLPTLQQVKSDPDYVNVRHDIYYKKSSVEVISKDPKKSKIKVTLYDFIPGDRLSITNWLLEGSCPVGARKKNECTMSETMLGSRMYNSNSGKMTSETSAGGLNPSYKYTPTGIVSSILFKQATGKDDYFQD